MITNTDLALALVTGLALALPVLAWAITRAWYLGRAQDRDRLLDRMEADLVAAKQVIVAAESAGFIQADHPVGRHEATPTTTFEDIA